MRFTSRSFRRNVSKKTRKARLQRRFKQVKQRTRRYKPKGFFKEVKPVTISFRGGGDIQKPFFTKENGVDVAPMQWDDKLDEVSIK